jgi:hypothetical protein
MLMYKARGGTGAVHILMVGRVLKKIIEGRVIGFIFSKKERQFREASDHRWTEGDPFFLFITGKIIINKCTL